MYFGFPVHFFRSMIFFAAAAVAAAAAAAVVVVVVIVWNGENATNLYSFASFFVCIVALLHAANEPGQDIEGGAVHQREPSQGDRRSSVLERQRAAPQRDRTCRGE